MQALALLQNETFKCFLGGWGEKLREKAAVNRIESPRQAIADAEEENCT